MDFSLTHCFIILLLYILLSIVVFYFLLDDENWTIIDTIYFAIVTFTTIGYGDVIPTTYYGKIFTCIYSLVVLYF